MGGECLGQKKYIHASKTRFCKDKCDEEQKFWIGPYLKINDRGRGKRTCCGWHGLQAIAKPIILLDDPSSSATQAGRSMTPVRKGSSQG
jgi:hypothetical protein